MSEENTTTVHAPPTKEEVRTELLTNGLANQEMGVEETTSMMISMYTPKYHQLVDKLTVFQAREMLKALPVYPLESTDYNPKNEIVRQAFAIGERLLEAKYTLILHTMFKNLDDQQKQDAINKGENNG